MTAHILFGASNAATLTLDLWAVRSDAGAGAVDLGVAIDQDFDPVRIGAVSLFIGGGATGVGQVWSTDGTVAGTHGFALAASGPALTVNAMQAFRGRAVVAATNPANNSHSLWITDGTRAGTTMLASGLSASGFAVIGDKLYFTGAPGAFNPRDQQLFSSDGTVAGTVDISPKGATVAPDAFAALADGQVLFENDRDGAGKPADTLWVTNGTAAGTRQLAVGNLGPDTRQNSFVSLGDRVLFGFAPGAAVGSALWVSDGTASGTRQIVVARGATVLSRVGSLILLGARVLFVASDAAGTGLWSSDGTDAGTHLLGHYAGLGSLTAFDGKVAFAALDAHGHPALWITDGTAVGTNTVAAPGASASGLDPQGLFAYFDRIGFTGADAQGRHGLWLSDGTSGGTGEVTIPDASTMTTATTALAGSGNVVFLDDVPRPYHAIDGDTVRGGTGQGVVIDPSGAILVSGGTGPLTFVGGTGFSTVTGGAGAMTVFGSSGGGIYSGGAAGGNVLIAGGGNTTLTGGGNGDRLFGASSGRTSLVAARGHETLVGGGGTTVFQAGAESGAVIFAGGGGSTVIGGDAGGDTVVGGSGALQVNARDGDAVFGGSGGAFVTGSSQGADSIIGGSGGLSVAGQGANMILVGGSGPAAIATGNGYALIFQGGGAMNINGGDGPLQLIAGGGQASIAVGSGGIVLDVVRGAAGGLDVIGGFNPQTDHVDLFGFSPSDVHPHVQNGSLTLSMSDGTVITLLGITDPGHAVSLI